MTNDVRILLERAAEPGIVTPDGTRAAMRRGLGLRWRRRATACAQFVLAFTLIVALASQHSPVVNDADLIAPAQPGRTEPEAAEATTQPSGTPREQAPVGTVPGTGAEIREPSTSSEDPVAPQVVTDCDPLIEDELGDTSLPTIDILSSSISYDVATNTLIFEHVVDDFIRHHEPGDGTHYDLHFTWDGLDYSAEAWISATGVENFAIVRQRRAPMHSSVAWVDLGTPEGHFDPAADTVTLRVSLDEFNEGERSASASEGHPPPQELKAGSQLTRLRLYARASRSNTTYSDHGYDYKGCNYVVGP